MKTKINSIILFATFAIVLFVSQRLSSTRQTDRPEFAGRQEVVFWHFWGGADRDIVDDVVRRFNESQDEHFVRAIAMPGNNLQAKLFLAIAGGDPPDLVNQDDPILGDWGWRGAIRALDDVCSPEQLQEFRSHLLPAALSLGSYQDRLYGVSNGLDIRALYYNKTALDLHGLQPPTTIEQLDHIALTVCPADTSNPKSFGYLPDSRRLWAWGHVFGGDFYDFESETVLVDSAPIQKAVEWMSGYADRYGADTINRFRQGDQSLPGKTFPLLPITDEETVGRYVLLMDGQWRARDIQAFRERRLSQNIACPEFGVCPLPNPQDAGRKDAGWVNGNFFVIPKGGKLSLIHISEPTRPY